jgi:hypothetical protein
MAEFLTTLGITSNIEQIINYAKKEIILISPYYQVSDVFYNRLCEASERGVNIYIVFGKVLLKEDEYHAFRGIPNLELYFCENLHAKCFFNEHKMVVSSMNMYAYSQINNREMGILIDSKSDFQLYENAKQEGISIINSSELIATNRSNSHHDNRSNNGNSNSRGYCIRCRMTIPHDFNEPFCTRCFSTWSEFRNYDYQENYCHTCGVEDYTRYKKPMCYYCYSRDAIYL